MRRQACAIMVAGLAALATPVAADWVHPFEVPQDDASGSDFFAVIEIPQGSFTKYEIHEETGYVLVDRFQSMPVVYPANYGSIPSSAGGDGDPLDVLVLTREPVLPGSLIRVRAIGVLGMIDGGEVDDKVVAVPVSDVDPHYDPVINVSDLPEIELQRIEQFFAVYKNLPEGRKVVELSGFQGANEAIAMVDDALKAYAAD